ncbi:hypothetical protein KGA66_26230 [Actinocrinis puniceicyclus]|jgi:hypothetical protein|uniref:Uncharacterized protein n=1 Tax=Actinocrinis puniceicyclus TaxID=977794 RepID=A0A8J8BH94_9ACTN|nr:hypothetical protein [Actinocrinis puniceicyclus]MBS2966564.1 hypothetical protein [Actinocrinis puniceicyclus]
MSTAKRTEQDVLQSLDEKERTLLKRVLEIERARLHISAADLTDDLLAEVKKVLP